MLKNAIGNLPAWLLIRSIELAILFAVNLAFFGNEVGISGAALIESAYSTILYAVIGYLYLGYGIVVIIVHIISSTGFSRPILAFLNACSPIYVVVAIYLSGSLPQNDPSYLLLNPYFMAALTVAILVNLVVYLKLYSQPQSYGGGLLSS